MYKPNFIIYMRTLNTLQQRVCLFYYVGTQYFLFDYTIRRQI